MTLKSPPELSASSAPKATKVAGGTTPSSSPAQQRQPPSQASSASPPPPPPPVSNLATFPRELHLNVLTFLRASELSAVQRTCRRFGCDRDLIGAVVDHCANVVASFVSFAGAFGFAASTSPLGAHRSRKTFAPRASLGSQYPPELTRGFDTPIVGGEVCSVAVASSGRKLGGGGGGRKGNQKNGMSSADAVAAPPEAEKVVTYEMLRNMEMLVVARVLSRPEPSPRQLRTLDDDSVGGGGGGGGRGGGGGGAGGGSRFYVSKSWCRAALRWLEVQEEERKEREERRRVAEEAKVAASAAGTGAGAGTPRGKGKGKGKHSQHHGGKHHGSAQSSSGKKRMSRKERRQRERKMSDAMPPWPNVNGDLVCEHGSIKQCSTKSARARRRVLDKQAWRVLKRLYPESVPLDADGAGCLLCAAEAETAKRAESDRKEEEKADRKKPLSCPLVRGFYTRGNKGYPLRSLVPPPRVPLDGGPGVGAGERLVPLPLDDSSCPLQPGVYCALPRSWCHRWRRYVRTGEGGPIPAPDASEVLCDAHNLPLVPPHLEAFLRGESGTLLGGNDGTAAGGAPDEGAIAVPVAAAPVGARRPAPPRVGPDGAGTLRALRAAGLSEAELRAQRAAMAGMEEGLRRASIRERERQPHPARRPVVTNEQLDRENRVVVEVLTDEEVGALEKWWPRQSCTYALRFAVVEGGARGGGAEVLWSTSPCRECDPSSRSSADDFVVRNRLQQKRASGSASRRARRV
ncbi:hypothetical protein ACHAWF_008572 [Thalassiosira exigua]